MSSISTDYPQTHRGSPALREPAAPDAVATPVRSVGSPPQPHPQARDPQLVARGLPWRVVLRRTADLTAALVLLVLAVPVMVTTAVVLRLLDGPQVLYRQTRIGHRGQPFQMYKFRTMVPGADQLIIDLRSSNEADGLLFKIRDDPRVTPIGRHLRTLAIDELPQLWNVIRGDMSLVGPRPALPDEVARYDERVARRLDVKPGLTGLWQVNGRHQLTFDDYVRYDLYYVDHRSALLDVKIVLRTIPALLARRGAH